ncbi:MAG TPA: hypothetical protein VHD83_18200 [Puia sp.]|nr:hypothetical protein [Puia sp.]
MDTTQELIQELDHIRPWGLATKLTQEQVETLLAEKLNVLIRDDFNGLVQLLYRIDVEEPRLRYLLQQHKGENAGRIIARLIIDRLLKKIETRRQYSAKKNDIPDEERW